MARKLPLKTPIFSAFNDLQNKFYKLWKFWSISQKQIEENQRQSQIISGKCLPS